MRLKLAHIPNQLRSLSHPSLGSFTRLLPAVTLVGSQLGALLHRMCRALWVVDGGPGMPGKSRAHSHGPLVPTACPLAPRRLCRPCVGTLWWEQDGCSLRGADVVLPPLLCALIPNLGKRGICLLPESSKLSCVSAEAPQGQAWFCLKKATKINLARGSREVTALLPSLSPAPKPSAGPLFPQGFQQVSIFFLLLLTKILAG